MKSNRLLVIVIIVLLTVTIPTISCNSAANPKNVKNSSPSAVVDYGNGVYYFPYVLDDFGNALSSFSKEHPSLEIVTMASDGAQTYGFTQGYFVIFRSN